MDYMSLKDGVLTFYAEQLIKKALKKKTGCKKKDLTVILEELKVKDDKESGITTASINLKIQMPSTAAIELLIEDVDE